MTRALVALFLAVAVLGCGGGTPPQPKSDPFETLKSLYARTQEEATRLRAVVSTPWSGTQPLVRLFRDRLNALDQWNAQAGELVAANAPRTPGIAALAADGGILAATQARFEPALKAAESFAPALQEAHLRSKGLKDAIDAVAVFSDPRVQIRYEAWREALRTAELAFARAMSRLASDPPDVAGSETDFRIASAGFAEAERAGRSLQDELMEIVRAGTSAKARREAFERRVAWAERVAAAAGAALGAEQQAALDAARRFRDGPLATETDALLKRLGEGAAGAVQEAGALAARADSALGDLTRAFLDAARKLGVGDPP
jgi:hypothetical protein